MGTRAKTKRNEKTLEDQRSEFIFSLHGVCGHETIRELMLEFGGWMDERNIRNLMNYSRRIQPPLVLLIRRTSFLCAEQKEVLSFFS